MHEEIRKALEAFPKVWRTVFQVVREREPGVAQIGALWEDSDSLAEVITVDTGNYFDNFAAMPLAAYLAACNPEAITALLADRDRLEAEVPRWQPIETAPKGTLALFCNMKAKELRHWAFVDWLAHDGSFCGNRFNTATHWMHLPAAPKEPTE